MSFARITVATGTGYSGFLSPCSSEVHSMPVNGRVLRGPRSLCRCSCVYLPSSQPLFGFVWKNYRAWKCACQQACKGSLAHDLDNHASVSLIIQIAISRLCRTSFFSHHMFFISTGIIPEVDLLNFLRSSELQGIACGPSPTGRAVHFPGFSGQGEK